MQLLLKVAMEVLLYVCVSVFTYFCLCVITAIVPPQWTASVTLMGERAMSED